MRRISRHGQSLVELLIALVILELIGAAALATALTSEHLGQQSALGAAVDSLRWQQYRIAEQAPACTLAAAPDTIALIFPAAATRPVLQAIVRCGP